jgi:hypothetical protein
VDSDDPVVAQCPVCRGPILRSEQVYYEVLGWERPRAQGGTNALRLRQRTGSQAHWRCIDREASGRADWIELIPSEPSDTVSVHPDKEGAA